MGQGWVREDGRTCREPPMPFLGRQGRSERPPDEERTPRESRGSWIDPMLRERRGEADGSAGKVVGSQEGWIWTCFHSRRAEKLTVSGKGPRWRWLSSPSLQAFSWDTA